MLLGTSAAVTVIFPAKPAALSPLNLKFLSPSIPLKPSAFLKQPPDVRQKPSVLRDSLRLLEWDKVCDAVASFAKTPLGREATKAQLGSLDQTYEESLKLLEETSAAVEILKYGGGGLDFTGIDVVLVESVVANVQRGLPVDGNGAIAVVALLQFARGLQRNLEAAAKEDSDCYKRFMPLSEVIMDMVISESVITSIQKVIDEDGSVKDTASSAVKNGRHQVRMLEKKIYLMIETLIRDEGNETSMVSSIDGRFCINFYNDQPSNIKGLLLSSDSTAGSMLEPFMVVSLNDELQQARATVAKAEMDVLTELTEKIKGDVNEIERLLFNIIKLDAINARASFSVSLSGTFPELTFSEEKDVPFTAEAPEDKTFKASSPTKREWIICLPEAYHPILLWQHHQALEEARKDLKKAATEIRRRKRQGERMPSIEETDLDVPYLEMQVSKLEQSSPVPVDLFVAHQTRVLVISGPNAGGKTICLKTVGLAAVMAKTGLYVLASERVRIPWFDSVFADIGDEQSLSQSLSTFSGHLKQMSDIQTQSTRQSLVLLDEVGAGTNPLEGTALGMSLLEYFAESALLTISTTHLGELKTLKYSNGAFENACMEFDEVKLKPTYRILMGIPGRSNAISMAERLGVPSKILHNARDLYGASSTNINAVIIDMERVKREFLEHFHEAQQYLMISRKFYQNLLLVERKIVNHATKQKYKKEQRISDLAAIARSVLRKKVRELGAAVTQPSMANVHNSADSSQKLSATSNQPTAAVVTERFTINRSKFPNDRTKELPSGNRSKLPKVGDVVHVTSLQKKAKVLKMNPSKDEVVVQAGNMKLTLKLHDVKT